MLLKNRPKIASYDALRDEAPVITLHSEPRTSVDNVQKQQERPIIASSDKDGSLWNELGRASTSPRDTVGQYCLKKYEKNARFFEEHLVPCANALITMLMTNVTDQYNTGAVVGKSVSVTFAALQQAVECNATAEVITKEQQLWFHTFLTGQNIGTIMNVVAESPRWREQDLKCKCVCMDAANCDNQAQAVMTHTTVICKITLSLSRSN